MAEYIILVEFRIKSECKQEFLDNVLENARHSVKEPGCLVFDVLSPHASSDRVLLYEAYTDREAFDRHVETIHVSRFEKAVASFVEAKTVEKLTMYSATHSPVS